MENTKMTKEEMLDAIINFAEVMDYIWEERLYWYEQVGILDKALSDIRHAVETEYDGDVERGNMYAQKLHEVAKERRQFKNMQELFLPVFNVYKRADELRHAINAMAHYADIIANNGRKYEPKVLPDLFKGGEEDDCNQQ